MYVQTIWALPQISKQRDEKDKTSRTPLPVTISTPTAATKPSMATRPSHMSRLLFDPPSFACSQLTTPTACTLLLFCLLDDANKPAVITAAINSQKQKGVWTPSTFFCKDLLSVRKPVRKIQEMEISRVLRFEGGRREQHTEFRASIDLRRGTRREDACSPVMISCSCCSHRRRCLQVLVPASCSSCKVQLPTGSLPLMLALRITKQKRNKYLAELTNAICNENGMMAYLPSVGKQRQDGETARRSAMALKLQKLRVEAFSLSRFLQAALAPSFCWSLLLV